MFFRRAAARNVSRDVRRKSNVEESCSDRCRGVDVRLPGVRSADAVDPDADEARRYRFDRAHVEDVQDDEEVEVEKAPQGQQEGEREADRAEVLRRYRRPSGVALRRLVKAK
jgi:hypothetical protein